jgi:predicted AlkP superfamily phosphohydrolase/phosphomutase
LPRLLIVGLDSVTFRVLKPLAEAGHLPAFQSIFENGAHGVLLSTIPSVTPPGWVTSFTGVDPGKHNVFDFKDHMTYLEGEMKYELASTTSRSVRAEPFWTILNREGVTVGMVNAPMTYPLEAMDGYAIAGFPCPTEGEGLFQPADLEEEIGREVPDYNFYGLPDHIEKGRPDLYLKRTNTVTQDRAKAFLHLMETRPTDVAMIVFTEVDRIQHYLWNCWDPEHPTHTPEKERYKDAFMQHYQVIDRNLGAMMEKVGPDVPVVIYSDHGANAFSRKLHLNTFLVEKGFIVMKGKGSGNVSADGKQVKAKLLDRRKLQRLFHRLGLDGQVHWIPKRLRTALPVISFETVDWARTRAFFSSEGAQAVTINLKGRQPEGSVLPGQGYDAAVEGVIEALQTLVDPKTGFSPIATIHRRDDLYEGPFVQNAPDLVIVPAEGYMLLKEFGDETFTDVTGAWNDRSGEHEREGVLLIKGPGVRAGQSLGEHHLRDIAPTLLHLCGHSVPRYMDGRVVEDAFEEGWLADHPVKLVGDEKFSPTGPSTSRMSPEEERILRERLKGLGYMG